MATGPLLTTTGPERTLVEGFRRPALAGGVPELIDSARKFPVLDLELLEEVLVRYKVANPGAAVGWFLERHRVVDEPSLNPRPCNGPRTIIPSLLTVAATRRDSPEGATPRTPH